MSTVKTTTILPPVALAHRLRAFMLNNSGGTLGSDGIEPTTGYVVAVKGAETTTDYIPTSVQIAVWLEEIAAPIRYIYEARGHKTYVGVWKDNATGKWVLDVSIVTDNLTEAIAIGQQNRQKCIWDLTNSREIPCGPTLKIAA